MIVRCNKKKKKKAEDFLEGILWRNGRCNGRLQLMSNYNFITFLLEC